VGIEQNQVGSFFFLVLKGLPQVVPLLEADDLMSLQAQTLFQKIPGTLVFVTDVDFSALHGRFHP
jgi:hypothetical protein